MTFKLASILILSALITGATATAGMAQETSFARPSLTSCHIPAPNEDGYGSRALSARLCHEGQQMRAENHANHKVARSSRSTTDSGIYAKNGD
jgi:hypothetical protein